MAIPNRINRERLHLPFLVRIAVVAFGALSNINLVAQGTPAPAAAPAQVKRAGAEAFQTAPQLEPPSPRPQSEIRLAGEPLIPLQNAIEDLRRSLVSLAEAGPHQPDRNPAIPWWMEFISILTLGLIIVLLVEQVCNRLATQKGNRMPSGQGSNEIEALLQIRGDLQRVADQTNSNAAIPSELMASIADLKTVLAETLTQLEKLGVSEPGLPTIFPPAPALRTKPSMSVKPSVEAGPTLWADTSTPKSSGKEIGSLFVSWCVHSQSGIPFESSFQKELKQAGCCSPKVSRIYRNGFVEGGQYVGSSTELPSAKVSALVNCDGADYLLPWPQDDGNFGDIEGFEIDCPDPFTQKKQWLFSVEPARLEHAGSGQWRIVTHGKLTFRA